MEITKEFLREVRDDINEALTVVAEAHGLKSLVLARGKYDSVAGNFSFVVEGIVSGGGNQFEQFYVRNCGFLSLPPLKTAFEFRGEGYVIVGMKPRGRTNILATRARDGKTFRFAPDAVRFAIAEQTAPAKKEKRR